MQALKVTKTRKDLCKQGQLPRGQQQKAQVAGAVKFSSCVPLVCCNPSNCKLFLIKICSLGYSNGNTKRAKPITQL